MANRAEQNQNKRLASAILAAKGVKMDDWLNEKYQEIITENTNLLIKSMAAQTKQPTQSLNQEERHNG
ncbi:hypothetical protein ACFQ41_13060 [Lacticaseibacillus suilingensis]|uniref:Uncharacterized protein n=1 Tax=Lacticaseibacillus suilingensis TaxID=2799577 RepID=A0ABW4BJL6_9LACO|nr:hypothetical protein [Lacticaseibacillus suilingensis]